VKRICFVLNIHPEVVDEYRVRHREVWPEMRDALSRTGWSNYSLFLKPDGMLIGYLETEDFQRAKAAMKEMPVNARWQEHMAPLFAGLEAHADDGMEPIEEDFHLD
jgi:L-rhamnose mutarotase